MPPEETVLGEDQFNDLATAIATKMLDAQTAATKKADDALAAQKVIDDAAEVDAEAAKKLAEGGGTEESGKLPTVAEITAGVVAALGEQTKSSSDAVYATMFSEKLVGVEGTVPGFTEYLDGNDDYGNKRRDQILKIEDYTARLGALTSISNAFTEAGVAPGKAPTLNPKLAAKAKENEDRYAETNKKLEKGEYTNVSDFTADYMGALQAELASLGA